MTFDVDIFKTLYLRLLKEYLKTDNFRNSGLKELIAVSLAQKLIFNVFLPFFLKKFTLFSSFSNKSRSRDLGHVTQTLEKPNFSIPMLTYETKVPFTVQMP